MKNLVKSLLLIILKFYVTKIDEINNLDRSRRLILRCYNTLATKSELSGVQVASYLMNFSDHYTNMSFHNIFLIGIERFLQNQLDIARQIKNLKTSKD